MWIWHRGKVAKRRGIKSSKIKNEGNLSNIDASLISWQLYPEIRASKFLFQKKIFQYPLWFWNKVFLWCKLSCMMEGNRKICEDLEFTYPFTLFSFHSFCWVVFPLTVTVSPGSIQHLKLDPLWGGPWAPQVQLMIDLPACWERVW